MTKVHCHLCGATLRRPEQFRERVCPDSGDVIFLCRDEARCLRRRAFDSATGQGPLAERHSLAKAAIRVHEEDGDWQVDYGSYAQGHNRSRKEAVEEATIAAARENRELTIEDTETASA